MADKSFSDQTNLLTFETITSDAQFGCTNDVANAKIDATIAMHQLALASRNEAIENAALQFDAAIGQEITDAAKTVTNWDSALVPGIPGGGSTHGDALSIDVVEGQITVLETGTYFIQFALTIKMDNVDEDSAYINVFTRHGLGDFANIVQPRILQADVPSYNQTFNGAYAAQIVVGTTVEMLYKRIGGTHNYQNIAFGGSTLFMTKIDP